MFQPGGNLYGIAIGSRPENVEVPHLDVRPPSLTDVNYPIGKHWVDTVGLIEYTLVAITTLGGVIQAVWDSGGNQAASQTTPGVVSLATLAQLESGSAPAGTTARAR